MVNIGWIFYSLIFHFRRLLIDTTDPNESGYITQLEGVLKEENSLISTIIATHWHHDHIGSIKDVKLRKLITDDCKIWKFPRLDAEENYDGLEFSKLEDGQEFDLGDDMKLKVVYTPGHTTDHAILFDPKTKALFSGDCILGEGTAVFEDLYDYMKSLDKILKLSPSVIYPGHGDVIDDPVERIEYYINHRNERERQILAAIVSSSDPMSDMDIVKVVYTTTPRHLWPAAAVNVNQHLIKLKKEGKVVAIEKNGKNLWKAAVNKL
jgi:endoribonuclease LACTB2